MSISTDETLNTVVKNKSIELLKNSSNFMIFILIHQIINIECFINEAKLVPI